MKLQSSTPAAHAAPIVVAVPAESTSCRRPLCRKRTKRAERTSSDDKLNCHKLEEISLTQGISENEKHEQAKKRLTCNSNGLHSEEPRSALFACQRRRTRITRSAPKLKEAAEFSGQTFELGTGAEVDTSQLSKSFSASPSENNHRIKEFGQNNIACTNTCSSHSWVNSRTRTNFAPESEELFYTLVPFGRNDNVCSLKGIEDNKSLWVRIDLNLLARIPLNISQEKHNISSNMDRTYIACQSEDLTPAIENTALKMRRKRKVGLYSASKNVINIILFNIYSIIV